MNTNTFLLEHSYGHPLVVHDCFQTTIAGLSSCKNVPWPSSLNCLLSDLFRKKLLILGVDEVFLTEEGENI